MIQDNVINEARDLIAGYITKRRKSLNLTQQELADRAGLGIRTVQRIEGKKFIPDGKSLVKISFALDCFFFLAEKESDEEWVKAFRDRWRRDGDQN